MSKKIHHRDRTNDTVGALTAETGAARQDCGVVLDFQTRYRARLVENISMKRRALSDARLSAIESVMRVVDHLCGDTAEVDRATVVPLLKTLRKSLEVLDSGAETVAPVSRREIAALEGALSRIDAVLGAFDNARARAT